MSPADKSLLCAQVTVSSTDLLVMDEKGMERYVRNQLRQQLADALLNVGEHTEHQTYDGLTVRHEVVVFSRKEFQRIVRDEARRMYERCGPFANTYYHTP